MKHILTILFLITSYLSHAAIVPVDSASAGAAVPSGVTMSYTVTATATLAVIHAYDFTSGGPMPTTLTAANGDVFTQQASTKADNGVIRNALYVKINPTAGATTISYNIGTSYPSLNLLTLRGTATTSPIDQQVAATRLAATTSSVNCTPATDNQMVLAGINGNTTTTLASSTGYVISASTAFVSAQHFGGGMAHLVVAQTTAAATTCTFTTSVSTTSTICMMSIKYLAPTTAGNGTWLTLGG